MALFSFMVTLTRQFPKRMACRENYGCGPNIVNFRNLASYPEDNLVFHCAMLALNAHSEESAQSHGTKRSAITALPNYIRNIGQSRPS
jgi:hypothetical protein